MQWFRALFFLGTVEMVIGTATQEISEHSVTPGKSIQSANDNIHLEQITTTSVGRFHYRDGEVTLFQNQLKPSDFFFTPSPHVEPNLTDCSYNDFSEHTELALVVSLYTTDLLESVKRHIRNQTDACHTKHCGVSLLPMHSVRLIQKGRQTLVSKTKYTLDSEWHSNTELRQMVEFVIYTSNMSACESLKNSITSRCRLSTFEIQYSLHSQQTKARSLEVSTEYIMKTSMYNKIKSQFPSNQQDTVALTGEDYKDLLSETMDQITISLRADDGFEGIQDPVAVDRILDRQLQYKQVQLTNVGDQIWESLYWTPELTRPDRLSKVLNKVMKQDATDSDKFRYDYSQANEALKQNLKLHDRQNFDNLEKHLAAQSQNTTHTNGVDTHAAVESGGSFLDIGSASGKVNVDVSVYKHDTDSKNSLNDDLIHYKIDMKRLNDTNTDRKNDTTIILERKDAEKLVRYLSQHVEIEGEIIKPKPIDVTLVKVGSLKSRTNLISTTVLVKTRTGVHPLPLRCPYEFRHRSSANSWLAEKYHRLSNVIDNLTNTVEVLHAKLSTEFNQKLLENFNRSERLLNAIEARLTQKIQKIEQRENVTNSALNAIEARLIQKIEKSENATKLALNRMENQCCQKQTACDTFLAQTESLVHLRPCSVAVVDVNSDNKPDIVVANSAMGFVSVLINTGIGTFNTQVMYATGNYPYSVAVVDVNSDNKPDIVVANSVGDTVSVLTNTGIGTFNTRVTYATGTNPFSLAVVDVNSDNKPDIVVANRGANTVSVLTNTGIGTFNTQVTYATGANPESIAVVDVNSDNKPDIIVTNWLDNSVGVLINTGIGTFNTQVTYATGTSPVSVAVVDVNSDNKPDIVTANYGTNSVSVLINTGTGTFNTQVTYATGTNPISAAVVDVNSDNKPDIVTANHCMNTVSVLMNAGTGTFNTHVIYATGTEPSSAAVVDVNSDNKPDIIVANWKLNTVGVLLSC